MSSRANVINLLAGEANIIFCLLRTPHEDTFTRDGWGMSQLFPVSPALNNFCQSPHFSHPSGHRSLEKVRRGVGDFNLVSTSSNLKGRAGGVREGDITGRSRSRGKYHRRILSTMTRREGDREKEGGKQTGKREIMCRLIGPGAREPGEWRVARAGAGDSSLVTHARADTGAETGLPECPDPRKLEIKWGQEENFNLYLEKRCQVWSNWTEEQVWVLVWYGWI